MGKRSSTESIGAVLVAFLGERTWRQSELARHVGIGVKALQRILDELSEHGVPLERDEEHPHVLWSVPKGWFPGGRFIDGAAAIEVARLVARLPRSDERDRALLALLGARESSAIAPSEVEADEAPGVLSALEDAIATRRPIYMRYFSASRGDRSGRTVSVHRIEYGPRARFVATCHRSGALKWFRADRVDDARPDVTDVYRAVDRVVLDDFVSGSADGFRGPDEVDVAFFVRAPEHRWVARNLPAALSVEPMQHGARVAGRTAALDRIAAFVVGLGAAAMVETPELRARVLELARGAIGSQGAAKKADAPGSASGDLNERPVRRNRVAG